VSSICACQAFLNALATTVFRPTPVSDLVCACQTRPGYLPREVFFLGLGLDGDFFGVSAEDLCDFFVGMTDPYDQAEEEGVDRGERRARDHPGAVEPEAGRPRESAAAAGQP
jgi:hypothetical protein